ncbi:copper resistance CopC family protein [Actinospongicola halichondriae]|uniref:copper resistance CopC family protein n=1 Tax=Actinospongicola halichondriae TaxID=3236844 RepID=UPI003D4B4CFD
MRRVLLVLAVLFAVLAPATPAGAHAEIRESDPEADGVAPTGTDELSMTFIAFDPDGPVIIDVHGPDGEELVIGDAVISRRDSVVTVPVKPLAEGVHTVEWSVQSDDGDGQSTGSFQFSVEPPPGGGIGIWLVWAVALAIPAFVFLRPGARKKKT